MCEETLDSMTIPTSDAQASLVMLSRELRESALAVLWRQWRAVGGQAASKGEAHAIVDPEALVLLSLTLVEHERRLADILHDWTVLNSDLLSVQRAKNLVEAYPAGAAGRLAWLAGIAFREGKDLRWRSLAEGSSNDPGAKVETPPHRSNKMRAVRVRLDGAATLLLRLRLGFGVGAKADLLGFLLGLAGEWAIVRDIRAATGYTTATVRRAAEDMAAAQLVHVTTRQPVAFRADPRAWSEVLGFPEGPPPWRSWQQRFAFVAAFLAWADEARAKPLTLYVLGVKGRELLEQHRLAFERDLVAVWSEHTTVGDWAAFLQRAVMSLVEWMAERA